MCGRLGADKQPVAMMQKVALTSAPSSVAIRQRPAASSKLAAVTRVSN